MTFQGNCPWNTCKEGPHQIIKVARARLGISHVRSYQTEHMKYLPILLALVLLVPLFLKISPGTIPVYNKKEAFDPTMAHLNSVKSLTRFTDSTANSNQIKIGSLGYGVLAASIIKKRFYHGFSYYTLQKNWLAVTAQCIFGRGLAAPVDPDEILKYPYAGCSQQAIVLMALMKNKNIPYRSVGFPHHYATELCFTHDWYYFDPNMEPEIRENDRRQGSWKSSSDSLKKYYHGNNSYLDWAFGNDVPAVFGNPNADPAPHAAIFQTVTKYLSIFLWVLPLCFIRYNFNRASPRRK